MVVRNTCVKMIGIFIADTPGHLVEKTKHFTIALSFRDNTLFQTTVESETIMLRKIMRKFRRSIYLLLDPRAWPGRGISWLNIIMLSMVLCSIAAAVLQSEAKIASSYSATFRILNWAFAVAFSCEYAVRIWSIAEAENYSGRFGRLRYLFSITSLADIVATAALWVDLTTGLPGSYGVLLRLTRVLRVITLTRNSAISIAIRLLGHALRERSVELLVSLGLAVLVVLISATVLFAVEGAIQPEAFGSIPRAMWWAMATLTTVGYGDVYPISVLGRICASLFALCSIAIVAMPAGIMAAAFSDAFQKIRQSK